MHLSALQRHPPMEAWFSKWTEEPVRIASPNEWTHKAQVEQGTWIWDIPPAAAPYALEELAAARLKRRDTLSAIVVIPRLMRPAWFRRFCRTVDLYFTVEPGCGVWPLHMHEPCLIGLCLPLLKYEPWSWRLVPSMVGLTRALCAVHKKGEPHPGDLLRKFWRARSWIASLQKSVMRRVPLGPF